MNIQFGSLAVTSLPGRTTQKNHPKVVLNYAC